MRHIRYTLFQRPYSLNYVNGLLNENYSRKDYIGVYQDYITAVDNADDQHICERAFERFNLDHPVNFAGHSFSVGDILLIEEGYKYKAEKWYLCCNVGFKLFEWGDELELQVKEEA